MNVRVYIEHLLLESLPVEASQAGAVQAAVESEITQLLAGAGLAPGLRLGGAFVALQPAEIQLSGSESADAVGRQIGRAIYGGIRE